MIVHSIPKRPDASPERKTVAEYAFLSRHANPPFAAGPHPKAPVRCGSSDQIEESPRWINKTATAWPGRGLPLSQPSADPFQAGRPP
jgi:hypothetical protein